MRKVYGILGIVVCLTVLAMVGYSANNKKFVRYPLEKGSLLYGALMNDNKEELKGKIVLDFGADYCPPCHQLTDMLEEEGMISYITQNGGEFRQIPGLLQRKDPPIPGCSGQYGPRRGGGPGPGP